MTTNFIQFKLWEDCNNCCKFCNNLVFNVDNIEINKINSLNYFIKILDSDFIKNYNEIGIIGGELFDTQLDNINVKKLFYILIDKIIKLIKNGTFIKFNISTALMFDPQKYLFPLLDYLIENKIESKILICTSFDLKYRFITNDLFKKWEFCMFSLYNKYPMIKVHTEIIVTQEFIENVLANKFDIKLFKNKYHTFVDYMEPNIYFYKNKLRCAINLDKFMPYKSDFIKFIIQEGIKNNNINLLTFLSNKIRSNTIIMPFNGIFKLKTNRRNSVEEDLFTKDEPNFVVKSGLKDSTIEMRKIVEEFLKIHGN